jgi:hypothetical protein
MEPTRPAAAKRIRDTIEELAGRLISRPLGGPVRIPRADAGQLQASVEVTMAVDTIQRILTIAAPIAVIIGVIIALLQLRNQTRLRQFELAMRLHSRLGEEHFVRHYQRVMGWKYRSYAAFRNKKSPEDHVSLLIVGVFFENMGLLLKRGLAPIDLLDDMLSGPILEAWPKTRPIWIGLREEHDHPAWAEWFEYLYNAMSKRMKELGRARS